MIITICGSMKFARQMKKTKSLLEEVGHIVSVPPLTEEYAKDPGWHDKLHRDGEHSKLKKKYDLIRRYYKEIEKGDAILVLNYTKERIKNYIGGNSFLEIGFAHVLGKKIYLLNPIPKLELYVDEIKAMGPVILNGDLSKLK